MPRWAARALRSEGSGSQRCPLGLLLRGRAQRVATVSGSCAPRSARGGSPRQPSPALFGEQGAGRHGVRRDVLFGGPTAGRHGNLRRCPLGDCTEAAKASSEPLLLGTAPASPGVHRCRSLGRGSGVATACRGAASSETAPTATMASSCQAPSGARQMSPSRPSGGPLFGGGEQRHQSSYHRCPFGSSGGGASGSPHRAPTSRLTVARNEARAACARGPLLRERAPRANGSVGGSLAGAGSLATAQSRERPRVRSTDCPFGSRRENEPGTRPFRPPPRGRSGDVSGKRRWPCALGCGSRLPSLVFDAQECPVSWFTKRAPPRGFVRASQPGAPHAESRPPPTLGPPFGESRAEETGGLPVDLSQGLRLAAHTRSGTGLGSLSSEGSRGRGKTKQPGSQSSSWRGNGRRAAGTERCAAPRKGKALKGATPRTLPARNKAGTA